MSILGWISAFFLVMCILPDAVRAIHDGYHYAMSESLLWGWWLGEFAGTLYAVWIGEWPYIVGFGLKLALLSTLLYYHYYPQVELHTTPWEADENEEI